MRIQLKSFGFSTGESLKEYVSRRLGASLYHWSDKLKTVVVRLSDNNGPKGGVDKTCAIHINGLNGSPLVVSAVSTDYFSAVDMAVKRAGRVVERYLNRR